MLDTTCMILPIHKGKVLLQKKSNGWALFGGHQEKGEKYRETAVREFREETGLRVGKDKLKGLMFTASYKCFYFKSRYKFTVRKNKETLGSVWIEPKEIKLLNLTPKTRKYLSLILKSLRLLKEFKK